MSTPPFVITPKVLKLSSDIQELLGELKSASLIKPSIQLRKTNRIKTVHHSLAIEGNSLTEKQISALVENKRVIGPKDQILEVTNALKLYDKVETLNPLKESSLFIAHKLLMANLVKKPGHYRSTSVGILKGTQVSHVAPQAKMVPRLMSDLFYFLNARNQIPFLIKACVFHYEFEFIHPFEDGNGRMGRLWQQLLLIKHSEIFSYVAVETLIHENQKRYYQVLEACDKSGDSTAFIEFSLELIFKSLENFKKDFRPLVADNKDRIQSAIQHFTSQTFSRKDYMNLHLGLSTATASRDLAAAVKNKIILKVGANAQTKYKKK